MITDIPFVTSEDFDNLRLASLHHKMTIWKFTEGGKKTLQ